MQINRYILTKYVFLFEINLATSASVILRVCLDSIIDYSYVKGEK